jgi:multiple sugar transport system permease protein
MNEERMQRLLTLATSGFLIVFCLAPFVFMAVISLSGSPEFLSGQTAFNATFGHYRAIITTPSLHFIDYLRNSLAVSAVSAAVSTLIAALAAYSLTRLELPGRVLILFLILCVTMFPQISLIGFLFKLMTWLGWINTYGALIFPYVAWVLPLSVWILVSYFAQLPRELDKAALIDGCTRWQILRKVIAPVALPGILSTALLSFIFAFNEFMFALFFTTDHRARTVPVGIALFQGLHGEIPWGNIMAASIVSIVPLLLLAVAFQRHIIQGLTRGAVKG